MSVKDKIQQYQDYIDGRNELENHIANNPKRLEGIHTFNTELLESAIDSVIEELEEQLLDNES
ncbi:MAG TPA: hypothetical protein PLD88_08545, partial [Candidatus Berkiella sp.]|nr:hypothetical protein [Candidatus Berkiella sp.]